MIKKLFLPLLACFCSSPVCSQTTAAQDDNIKLLVGTYTEGGNSQGIYLFNFNQSTGTYQLVSGAEAHNPSFITLSKDKKHVYAVSEYNDGRQGIYSFRLDEDKNQLTNPVFLKNYTETKDKADDKKTGGDPCHIRQVGHHVITANYTGGSMSVAELTDKGELKELKKVFSFQNKASEKVSHIHCIIPSPDGLHLFATDLGMDCIYRFDAHPKAQGTANQVIDNIKMAYRGKQGSGPRHLTFHPNGKYAYLINELNGEVVVFAYQGGELKEVQTIMADEGKGGGSADIHVSPDGRFLYASHRLKKDGLSIFTIDTTTGKITKVGYQKTAKHPRNFNITPNGQFLLVAGRDNNVIEIFKRNEQTGKLKKIKKGIAVSKPVCVEFLTL